MLSISDIQVSFKYISTYQADDTYIYATGTSSQIVKFVESYNLWNIQYMFGICRGYNKDIIQTIFLNYNTHFILYPQGQTQGAIVASALEKKGEGL